MAKKGSSTPESSLDSVYPYIAQFKSPQWQPLFFSSAKPDRYLPSREIIEKFVTDYNAFFVQTNMTTLEQLFWFVSLKRLVDPRTLIQRKEYYEFILKCEYEDRDYIGFLNELPLHFRSKNGTKQGNPTPNLYATCYGLLVLYYIGRLNEYLEGRSGGETRKKILNFVNAHLKPGKYQHCDNKCEICKTDPPEKILFHGLIVLDLLGTHPAALQAQYGHTLKDTQNSIRNGYRLLILRYLGLKDFIKDEELLRFYKYQKPNGGFTFENSAIPNTDETFWIVQTLEAYNWMLPYPPGPIFAFIVQYVNALNYTLESITQDRIIPITQILLILEVIWDTLIDEVETLIFTNFSDSKVMDLNILSIEGGVQGAEANVIEYINQRYNFTLEIWENETLFRRYLNSHLDAFQQPFAKSLQSQVARFTQFSISEIREDYNKGKRRKNKITDDFLLKLLQEMIAEHFFKGKITKKGRKYIFNRDVYIDRVLTCDRPISKENIVREKRRIKEVSTDIYNMTLEMKNADDNIMNEVESLIIAEELALAEERIKINIKKALFDASFFNKTIESFKEEFVYLKAGKMLESTITKWNNVYNSLQTKFSNIQQILMEKIAEIRQEKDQRQIALDLEKLVQNKINIISDRFENYQEVLGSTLETQYSRSVVKELESNLRALAKLMDEADKEIKHQTERITREKADIIKLRKKAIDNWVSQLEEFQNLFQHYESGFDIWNTKVNQLDITHQNFIHEIEEIGRKVHEAVQNRLFDRALKINEDEFTRVLKDISKVSKNLKNELDDLFKKHRKLYPLLKNIQTEWILYQNVLEKLTHQMREEFKSIIQTDLKWSLREDFKLLIEKSIIILREEMVNFSKYLSSLFHNEEEIPEDRTIQEFKKLGNLMRDKDREIIQKYKEGTQKTVEFQTTSEQILSSWTTYKDQFEKSLEDLNEKCEDEKIIHKILRLAQQKNTNFLNTKSSAEILGLKEQILIETIKRCILAGRINADFLPKQSQFEIHNEDWRKWLRLKQFIEVPIREIDMHAGKIVSLLEKSISNQVLTRNTLQFESLSDLFQKKVQATLLSYEEFIQDQKINLQNPLLRDEDVNFRRKMEEYKTQIKLIRQRADRTVAYQHFLEEQIKDLENIVHSEIHRLSSSVSTRNIQNYNKNLKWFETQKEQILQVIRQKEIELEDQKRKSWQDMTDVASLITELHKRFDERKASLLSTFETAMSDILEKISSNELTRMKEQMEGIIKEKQEELNRLVTNVDKDVRIRINMKEFKPAAVLLKTRIKEINVQLKKIEKELTTQNRIYENKSKIFGIKHRYLIEQWEIFLLEYLNVLHEKEVELEESIIENYLRFAAKALKGNIVPLKMISTDLGMRRDYVQSRLVALIGDGKLTGKINVKLEIYYEGEDQMDDQTISQLEVLSATNVKFYLRLNRLTNVARFIAPLLTLVASTLTVGFYISRLSAEVAIWPILILAVIFIGVFFWFKRGRDKAQQVTRVK